MPIIPAALREPSADQDEGEATPSTARELKALAADPTTRKVAFPQNKDLANLPLLPPAPPEADDRSSRSTSKPFALEAAPADGSPGSNRSRGASKPLETRRRTTSKGKVQVAVPEELTTLSVLEDSDIAGLPGVRESHIQEAFHEMDFDGNGFVGVSELRYLLTVIGEEPTDNELDEMLAMLGGEGDGQVAYEDFRTLFAPKSAVLAEMLTMAPQEAEEEAKDGTAEAEGDEPDEIPRLEAPAQQLGLLVKGAASFMQARIKKEDAGKKKASRARPKAKAPGSNRARPVLGPPRQLLQMTAPSAMGPSNPGTFRVSSQPPPVPGHMSSMPPLPPGYMVGTEKMFQHQQGLGQGAQGAMGTAGAGAMGMMGAPGAPMGANGLPGMPNAGGHAAGPAAGQQGQPAATVDPLLQSSAKNFSANAPPKHLTFLEYQEMKLEHEVQQKLQQEAESDSD